MYRKATEQVYKVHYTLLTHLFPHVLYLHELSFSESGDIKELAKKSFVLKEGCQYRIKIYFYVQREIVTGLRYDQRSYRKGVKGILLHIG